MYRYLYIEKIFHKSGRSILLLLFSYNPNYTQLNQGFQGLESSRHECWDKMLLYSAGLGLDTPAVDDVVTSPAIEKPL